MQRGERAFCLLDLALIIKTGKTNRTCEVLSKACCQCRHRLTINIETNFIPRIDTDSNGAEFVILYSQNYGDSFTLEGLRKPIRPGTLPACLHTSTQMSASRS
jgi:hypothetical protein